MRISIQRIAAVFLTFVFAMTMLVSPGPIARAASITEQIAQIQSLLSLIKKLQIQLAALNATNRIAGNDQCTQITRDLYLGASDSQTGGEVSELQQFLQHNGYYTYPKITGYYGSITRQAVLAFQQAKGIPEVKGQGTVGAQTRAEIAGMCSLATVDQSTVTSNTNMFTLSGTADPSVPAVVIALVDPRLLNASAGTPTWSDIYNTSAYVAYSGGEVVMVTDGKWKTDFTGVPTGSYDVYVFENGTTNSQGVAINEKFLTKHRITVTTASDLTYTAGSGKSITLGIGQTADDGGVAITLKDVFLSSGRYGSPEATFLITPKNYNPSSYTVGQNQYVAGTGGFSDQNAPNGGVRIKVESIYSWMNTATIQVFSATKG